MAHRKRSNQGVSLTRVEWALNCARRVALRNAGVDMGRARRSSEGAIKAHKTIKAKKEKQK
jgi:hypothetical protein